MRNHIWWFKKKKDSKERKHREVNNLYSIWAKKYDSSSPDNLIIVLEEKYLKEFFGKVKDKDILDLGCGTGRHAITLAKKGAKVTAIDFTNAMIKRAKDKAKKARLDIDFEKADITKYSSKKKFDLIISMLVQDHIQNLNSCINVINKASKLGTEVVISNIHPNIIFHDLKKGRGLGWLIEGYKTNQYYHPIEEYVDLFYKKGFILKKIKNIFYEKKYQKKKFAKFFRFEKSPLGIIMKFEKIR